MFVHGLTVTDPTTLVAAGGALGAVSLLASLGPAMRAAAVDPAVTLRHE